MEYYSYICVNGNFKESGSYQMDAVITYVNGNDPVWKRDYEKYTNVPVMEKRFRDWGTLKYLLRGIQTMMPFVHNVYLVVSHPSQVPEWADTDNLKIILHKDIIPEEYLPTFNCNPIEMHLHRIPGLSEEYLYFNDDMFPVGKCEPTEFFREGKGVIGMYRHLLSTNMYKKICRLCDQVARRLAGKGSAMTFMRPQHICSPMLKSVCTEIYDSDVSEIRHTSLCRTRLEDNLCQYVYIDYMYHKGLIIPEKISNKHFSVGLASAGRLKNFLMNPDRKMVCINDVKLNDKKYAELREVILEAFETKFPDKSRFEK